MNAGEIVGLAGGVVVLLAAAWRLLVALHRGANVIEGMGERIGKLELTVKNGVSSNAQKAADAAGKACQLAGRAAADASTARQQVAENHAEVQRELRAVRAEVNAFANAAISDVAGLWETLAAAGIDRRSEG